MTVRMLLLRRQYAFGLRMTGRSGVGRGELDANADDYLSAAPFMRREPRPSTTGRLSSLLLCANCERLRRVPETAELDDFRSSRPAVI